MLILLIVTEPLLYRRRHRRHKTRSAVSTNQYIDVTERTLAIDHASRSRNSKPSLHAGLIGTHGRSGNLQPPGIPASARSMAWTYGWVCFDIIVVHFDHSDQSHNQVFLPQQEIRRWNSDYHWIRRSCRLLVAVPMWLRDHLLTVHLE